MRKLIGSWHLSTMQGPDFLAEAASEPPSKLPFSTGELRFDDPEAAFAAHSNTAILRSLAVFSVCSIKPLVKYADTCLRLAKRVVGPTLVNSIVKRTFFKHFCAGVLTGGGQ